jgi:uncharacterized protein YlzI (FlbEa/FlbD family)
VGVAGKGTEEGMIFVKLTGINGGEWIVNLSHISALTGKRLYLDIDAEKYIELDDASVEHLKKCMRDYSFLIVPDGDE